MFEFDPGKINRLNLAQRHRILLEGRELFVVFAVIIFTLGLMIMLGGEGVWGMWFIVLALILIVMSCSRILFMRSEKQDRFIMSSLVEKAMRRSERQTGHVFSEAERDKIRFKYDPIFHDQITAHSYKHIKTHHRQKIAQLRQQLATLERERAAELARLEHIRWQNAGSRDLCYSLKDGQIRLNQTIICAFSEIEHAEVIFMIDQREVKRVSGRAVRQRCDKFKDAAETKLHQQLAKHGRDHSAEIEEILPELPPDARQPAELVEHHPVVTCSRIGVQVRFKDRTTTAIILVPGSVDWKSAKCQKAYRLAQRLVRELELLAATPMPELIIPVNEEPSVLEYDRRIQKVRAKLERTTTHPPQAEIPERYLMGDEDPTAVEVKIARPPQPRSKRRTHSAPLSETKTVAIPATAQEKPAQSTVIAPDVSDLEHLGTIEKSEFDLDQNTDTKSPRSVHHENPQAASTNPDPDIPDLSEVAGVVDASCIKSQNDVK